VLSNVPRSALSIEHSGIVSVAARRFLCEYGVRSPDTVTNQAHDVTMIEFRQANVDDFTQALALNAILRGIDDNDDVRRIRAASGVAVVAVDGQRVVGFGVAYPWCGEAPRSDEMFPQGSGCVWWQLDDVVVDPSYRGKGVGSRLVRDLVRQGEGYGTAKTCPAKSSTSFAAHQGFRASQADAGTGLWERSI